MQTATITLTGFHGTTDIENVEVRPWRTVPTPFGRVVEDYEIVRKDRRRVLKAVRDYCPSGGRSTLSGCQCGGPNGFAIVDEDTLIIVATAVTLGPDLLTTTEAADLMGCDRSTIDRWINDGSLVVRKMRGSWRLVAREDIEARMQPDSKQG